MRSNKTRRLVLAALFTALICVVTYFAIPIPALGGGYINIGDAIIYTAAIAMGNPWAAAAAGLGSALSDILTGFAYYAPGTLVIKGLMGLIVGLAFNRKAGWKRYLGLMCSAASVMVVGYTLYQFLLFLLNTNGLISIKGGVDSPFAVSAIIWQSPIFWNLLQGVAGVAVGLALSLHVKRIMPKSMLDAFLKQS